MQDFIWENDYCHFKFKTKHMFLQMIFRLPDPQFHYIGVTLNIKLCIAGASWRYSTVEWCGIPHTKFKQFIKCFHVMVRCQLVESPMLILAWFEIAKYAYLLVYILQANCFAGTPGLPISKPDQDNWKLFSADDYFPLTVYNIQTYINRCLSL